MGIGQTLKGKMFGIPVWAIAALLMVLVYLYLSYRKNKAAAQVAAAQNQATSSDLGTVPISNLSTAAMPMPIQMGDTFVSTTVNPSTNVNPGGPIRCMNQECGTPPAQTLTPASPPQPTGAVNTIPAQQEPGYGAGLGTLIAKNPGIMSANTPGGANIPGITGYHVTYNGVPI